MQMTNSSAAEGFHPNTRLLAMGAAMTGLGAMVVAAGAAMVGLSLAVAGRRWVQSWETPPTEMAQRTFAQARMAGLAGRDAWRSGPSVN
ncbi:hypothetical protein DN069_23135 [Streptacidiphilus pinicola]|uniref:Uncharacterized protein n=2 Tax=Streptacidiphilus pinicola TaxID=2219663 RepID=A0A2X0IFK7_9ACTN|nr:hypothetical protein DN069_23135 [Streptacidiphilus pinicola]